MLEAEVTGLNADSWNPGIKKHVSMSVHAWVRVHARVCVFGVHARSPQLPMAMGLDRSSHLF